MRGNERPTICRKHLQWIMKKENSTDIHQMLLTICKCCGADSLLCVTFLAVPILRTASISSLQGEVPGSQRCPGEQLGYTQAARFCTALPEIPPWGQPGQPPGSLALEQFCPGAGEDWGYWLRLCMAWVTSSNPQWPGSWRAGGYCSVVFAVSW